MKHPPARSRFLSFVTLVCAIAAFPGCARKSGPTSETEPTNAGEAAAAAARETEAQRAIDAKYAAWVATLEPERQAWESLLGKHLGPFYLPRHKEAIVEGRTDAWEFVKDDPSLPRVLIIGDSISIGYTPVVRKLLAGKANVHRAPANCGYTYNAPRFMDDWLQSGKWDVIVFNFGIHDRDTPVSAYKRNLTSIIERLNQTGAKLIWATTTPMPLMSSYGWKAKFSIMRRNSAAKALMAEHGIPVADLYSAVSRRLDELQRPNDVHFLPAGAEALGTAVAAAIRERIAISEKRRS